MRGLYSWVGDTECVGAQVYLGGREGMRATQKESSQEWVHKYLSGAMGGVHNGLSFILLEDVVFRRETPPEEEAGAVNGTGGTVQVLIFALEDQELIGYEAEGERHYCCTEALAADGRCRDGTAVIQAHDGSMGSVLVMDVEFEGGDSVALAEDKFVSVQRTNMYHVWFINCDKRVQGVTVAGRSGWKNPTGYLPGMLKPFQGFFGALSLVYLFLGAAWLLLMIRTWRDLINLQFYISLVLVLSMIECSIWYFDYDNFNRTGTRPYATTVFAVLFGSVRKALARVLVLVVSMGYGVVKPTLGGYNMQVKLLGAAYFFAVLLLDCTVNVGSIDDMTSAAKLVLVLPVSLLDSAFIVWIFSSLSKTLVQLQQRRQAVKYAMYRHFTNVLGLCVAVSIGWIFYEMHFKVRDRYNARWQDEWVTTAFWYVLNLVLLLCICTLWAPSQNAKRYAYSEADGDGVVEEDIELANAPVLELGDEEEEQKIE